MEMEILFYLYENASAYRPHSRLQFYSLLFLFLSFCRWVVDVRENSCIDTTGDREYKKGIYVFLWFFFICDGIRLG